MRAALKKKISTDWLAIMVSSLSRTAGMEGRSERSIARAETLAVGEAAEMKGASEVCRRWVLRERRIMWFIPLEAKAAATCWGDGLVGVM